MDRRKTLIQAYRTLYRSALRAVLHASPARYQIRDTMRRSFSPDSGETFNAQQVANTIAFLRRAEEYSGTEHKILQNLLHVRYWQSEVSGDTRLKWTKGNSEVEANIRRHSWAQFNATLEQFNRSMNLCLR